jgi:hypothetical protein
VQTFTVVAGVYGTGIAVVALHVVLTYITLVQFLVASFIGITGITRADAGSIGAVLTSITEVTIITRSGVIDVGTSPGTGITGICGTNILIVTVAVG